MREAADLRITETGIRETGMASRALDALTLGVVVTDRRARRVYSNAEADRLLGSRTGALHMIGGDRIGAADQETQKIFHEAIVRICTDRGADSHHFLALSAEDGRPALSVCITPVATTGQGGDDGAAMILLRVIERECNVEIEGRRLFGLTRAEAKFASAIASGLSLAEAARHHAVGMETARTHMKSIFRKTGFCRQSQVAALMRGAQMPVRAVGAEVEPARCCTSGQGVAAAVSPSALIHAP